MDEKVIKYYRILLKTGFIHSGSIKNPSIFLDAGSDARICAAGNHMQLYIDVVEKTINDIKYSCFCDPNMNVAVEILCTLIKGKSLDEADSIPEQEFYHFLGSDSEELQKKVKGLKELLKVGISRYKTQLS